jgi:Transposase DDE domain
MAGKRRTPLRESEIQGLKYFEQLVPLLARLHEEGCQRDQAGNRQLHYDQYCLLLLLAMFSPLVESLRALQQASELAKVQQRLGVKRVSLGSLSEAVQVFDPQRLREIVEEFGSALPPLSPDPRLNDLRQAVTLVDGTILTALPRIAAAFWGGQPTTQRRFAWRLHTHFEVLRGVPTQLTLTEPRNGGATSERAVLAQNLQSDRCYVTDRGFQSVKLFNAIVAAQSSYVCRIQEKTHLEVVQEYPLSDEARQQQIVHDALVQLGDKESPDHAVRVVTLEITPHVKRSGHKGDAGPANRGLLLIATNLLDVPAEIIAWLYLYRWQIEMFFRFFKCVLGCKHLFSHHPRGIEIQTYCAILACLLISLWTGRKPNQRTYEMLCWYFLGIASEEDLQRHLEKLTAQAR